MPFRERMRRMFGRMPQSSSPSTATAAATTGTPGGQSPHLQQQLYQKQQIPHRQVHAPSKYDPSIPKRTKSQMAHVYRIGEPMPPPKYPGKYDKPHQDLLRAFTFAAGGGSRGLHGAGLQRRFSDQTDVSPMGSRWASRKNSEVDAGIGGGGGGDGGVGGGGATGGSRRHTTMTSVTTTTTTTTTTRTTTAVSSTAPYNSKKKNNNKHNLTIVGNTGAAYKYYDARDGNVDDVHMFRVGVSRHTIAAPMRPPPPPPSPPLSPSLFPRPPGPGSNVFNFRGVAAGVEARRGSGKGRGRGGAAATASAVDSALPSPTAEVAMAAMGYAGEGERGAGGAVAAAAATGVGGVGGGDYFLPSLRPKKTSEDSSTAYYSAIESAADEWDVRGTDEREKGKDEEEDEEKEQRGRRRRRWQEEAEEEEDDDEIAEQGEAEPVLLRPRSMPMLSTRLY